MSIKTYQIGNKIEVELFKSNEIEENFLTSFFIRARLFAATFS